MIKQETDRPSGINILFTDLNRGDRVLGLGESDNSCLNCGPDGASGNFRYSPWFPDQAEILLKGNTEGFQPSIGTNA